MRTTLSWFPHFLYTPAGVSIPEGSLRDPMVPLYTHSVQLSRSGTWQMFGGISIWTPSTGTCTGSCNKVGLLAATGIFMLHFVTSCLTGWKVNGNQCWFPLTFHSARQEVWFQQGPPFTPLPTHDACRPTPWPISAPKLVFRILRSFGKTWKINNGFSAFSKQIHLLVKVSY